MRRNLIEEAQKLFERDLDKDIEKLKQRWSKFFGRKSNVKFRKNKPKT